MRPPVISVHGLSKRYVLGAMAGHDTLRDQLAHGTKALLRAFQSAPKPEVNGSDPDEFWALKDVSFELGEGEVLGVVGRNGAGKSTLLKILSQITEPTEGEIRVRGRVASLLEVGTGFHPELSGRENVYLNGAVLGMTRREIRAKFDEIVAFAEVEKFLDTPVKRYSSGMYVRLAFAVAAHLEPEILIVDEVLAVGDAAFQKKCLGKMSAVASAGRTVLFVSHNMGTILSLCTRCLLLQCRLVLNGTPAEVVNAYLHQSAGQDSFHRVPQANGKPTVIYGRIIAAEESAAAHLELTISCGARYTASLDFRLLDSTGVPVGLASLGTFDDGHQLALQPGLTRLRMEITTTSLANGSYYVCLDLANPFVEYYDRTENCLSFQVTRSAARGGSRVFAQNWGCGSVHLPVSLVENAPA